MNTTRMIVGTRYTQAARRDQAADFTTALTNQNPLMYLHGLGYNCADARIVNVTAFAPGEYTFQTDAEAHTARRRQIGFGMKASLVAFDTTREVYAFDVL